MDFEDCLRIGSQSDVRQALQMKRSVHEYNDSIDLGGNIDQVPLDTNQYLTCKVPCTGAFNYSFPFDVRIELV